MSLGDRREYSASGAGAGGSSSFAADQYGKRWVNPDLPHLVFEGNDVLLESGATGTKSFTKFGNQYAAAYFVRDTLRYDAVAHVYVVTSPDGDLQTFDEDGVLVGKENPGGTQATYTYTAGELNSVQVGSGTDAVGYYYSFDTLGRVESVVMRVGGTTSASDYRRTLYTYTDHGSLKLIELEEKKAGTWHNIETTYYRYHAAHGLLWFVVDDHAYKQMKAVHGTWPEEASNAQVAQYADAEFYYYGDQTVKEVKTNGGKYRYGVSYQRSAFSGATTNVWTNKVTVQMPDGSTNTYYYNRGQSLLLLKVSEPQESGPAKVWYPICQQFDANSRMVLSASSSAVASINEGSPTLVNLRSDAGLVQVYQYDGAGNVIMEGLQKGASGSLVKLVERAYKARTVNGMSIYVPTAETTYRDATDSEASNPVTKKFAYTWYTNTFQIETLKTTLPAVPGTENGNNKTGTLLDTFDVNGLLVAQLDAVGTTTTYEYFATTSALKTMVQDAGAGRLNLKTEYTADPLGRTTLEKGPEHYNDAPDGSGPTLVQRATWTQYLDSQDQIRTINGYIAVGDGNEYAVGPIRIEVTYADDPEMPGGRMTETIAVANDGGAVPSESTTFSQSDYLRWSTQHFDKHDQLVYSRLYHLIPASGSGSSGTNYAQTNYRYDSAGRQNRVTLPEGTIQLMVYNAMSWAMESKVGTSTANLVSTVFNEYDEDGNLTQVTRPVDEDNDRVADFRYDWRNRQTKVETNDGTRTLITQSSYDNRDNVAQLDEYQTAVDSANLLNRAQSFFDGRNRQYRKKRFGVEVGTGTVGAALTSEFYFDQAGRTLRETPAGKVGFTVFHYDAVGRILTTYSAFGGSLDLRLPGRISNTIVMEQSEFAYDAAGNLLSTTTRKRFDDTTKAGALRTPTTQPKARVSYVANYQDELGRTQAVANYGTYDGAAWTRPDSVPGRSDTVLVTSYTFDDAGEQQDVVDPMGTVTRQEFDQAGRRVTLIENYISGGPTDPDVNKTTQFEYNLDGNITKLTAVNSVTGDQLTQWIYGVTVAQGSELESNSLIYQKIYPDTTLSSDDRVTYSYNIQSQVITIKDQAGTVHAYGYDQFGRLLDDVATAPSGSPIDMSVDKISRTYEVRGMLETVTSFHGEGVVNDLLFVYDDYSRLVKDYQEHDGPVDLEDTLFVGYEYADGSANTVRRTGVVYPAESTTITFDYGDAAADALSRPNALKEGSSTLCSYRFLGLGMVIGVKYDAANGVESTFRDGGTVGGDPYTGLDRFGRIIETLWKNAGGSALIQSQYGRNRFGGVVWRRDDTAHAQSVDTEDNYYWYDGLYQVQENQRGELTGSPVYTGITDLQKTFEWEYDPTGNWTSTTVTSESDGYVLVGTVTNLSPTDFSFGHLIGTPPVGVGDTIEVAGTPFTVTAVTINSPIDPATQDGYYTIEVAESISGLSNGDEIKAEGTMALPQERQQNPANEITYLWPPGTPEPTYDPAGNMTLLPPILGAEPTARTLIWDAWNRLIEVNDGSTNVTAYTYDGLGRRATKTNATEIRNYYYDDQWRPLEERVNEAAVLIDRQYTWGIRDRCDLIRRERSTGGSSLSQTHYCLRDYLDPVAIVDADGVIQERYAYDAFGSASFLASDYSASSSSFEWEFLFHCEFQDADTGLYNYGYRYYTPSLGRWLSRDPVEGTREAGSYTFTCNTPISCTDFIGLKVEYSNGQATYTFVVSEDITSKTTQDPYDFKFVPDNIFGWCHADWETSIEGYEDPTDPYRRYCIKIDGKLTLQTTIFLDHIRLWEKEHEDDALFWDRYKPGEPRPRMFRHATVAGTVAHERAHAWMIATVWNYNAAILNEGDGTCYCCPELRQWWLTYYFLTNEMNREYMYFQNHNWDRNSYNGGPAKELSRNNYLRLFNRLNAHIATGKPTCTTPILKH